MRFRGFPRSLTVRHFCSRSVGLAGYQFPQISEGFYSFQQAALGCNSQPFFERRR
jgi:hypothetical protein